MLVYWIDYGFSTVAEGKETSYTWRIPTILQCVFLVPMIFIILIIPETPRWLVAHDRNDDALKVLRQLNKGMQSDEDITAAHKAIVDTVALETNVGSGSWKDLLHNDGKSGRVLTCLPSNSFLQRSRANVACLSHAAFRLSNSLVASML